MASSSQQSKAGTAARGEHDVLVLEVFPEETSTNIEELCSSIRSVEAPGLKWTERYALEDVGFGINKIRMQAVIPPSLPTDEVLSKVAKVPGVKSVQFMSLTDNV